ncbi:hypothetical protein J2X75_000020 [Paenibacillus sp. 2003]|nr:hypothetical protein [Paenibacillus sp. 2003]
MMKWQEVQQIFPNQFVKFEVLHSEETDNQEIIDDVAVLARSVMKKRLVNY